MVLTYPGPDVPPDGGGFTLGKVKKNKKNGSAKLTVTTTTGGTLDLGGKKVKPTSTDVAGAGDTKLKIKAKGKEVASRLLEAKRRAQRK